MPARIRAIATILSIGVLAARGDVALADHGFRATFLLGAAKSLDARTTVAQAGQPALEFTGSYESRSFEPPLYYAWRLSWLHGAAAFELQLVHHKLHLERPPPEVQHFEISHGFNLLTLGYARRWKPIEVRFATGVVVAHAESRVRGLVGDGAAGGYELTGPAFLVGAGRTWPVAKRLFVTPEVFVSAARARVAVARGRASLFNVAFHALVGIGLRY